MLSLGDGIAISTVTISLGGYLIMLARRSSKSGDNGKVKFLTEEHHEQICKLTQENVGIRFDNIEEDLQEIKADLKALLQRK